MTQTVGAIEYGYEPSPRQSQAHSIMVDELLYGGAAGGGKTRFALAEAVLCALMVPGARILILRRNYPDLEDIEDKLREQMPEGVAVYRPGKHRWEFHVGSIIRLGHLAHEDDVNKYVGQEYTLIIFEEATEFSPDQYLMLLSRLRASGRVKDRLEELGWRPRSIATANPGRRSHQFFKDRFVDAAPPGEPFIPPPTPEDPDPGVRCYIPARHTDNPHIDPTYVRRLNALPESRRRAFRDGDWDVLEGVRFPQFRRSAHVISPEQLPLHAMTGRKAIGVDYGYNDPFAAVWLCKLADGLVVAYRELYAVGLTATQQAEKIRELSAEEEALTGEKIPVIADPAMWHRPNAASDRPLDKDAPPVGSPAHFYQQVLGKRPYKANNARTHGWNLLDEKLRVRDDGVPRLLIYDTCLDLIRTLPQAPRDKKRPEDLDTSAEEHNLDALRYGTMWLEGRGMSRAPAEFGSGRRRPETVAGGLRSAPF